MEQNHPVLSVTLRFFGVLLLAVALEAGGHILLLKRKPVGTLTSAGGRFTIYAPDYRFVGEFGTSLFAPAIKFDLAVRPDYWCSGYSLAGIDLRSLPQSDSEAEAPEELSLSTPSSVEVQEGE